VDDLEKAISKDRQAHGKKPLKPKEQAHKTKEVKSSTTKEDSDYMVREGKPFLSPLHKA